MARPLSTKSLTTRVLNDATSGPATKYAALIAAKPHLTFEEYGRHLRQLAAVARAKVLRLCLLALAEHESAERTMAEGKAKAEADAKKRAEIDAVLRECEAELAGSEPGNLNANPVEHTEPTLGTPAASLPDPDNGVLSANAPAATGVTPCNGCELEEQRADVLKRGRELAEKVLHQTDRCYRAVFNKQEAAQLDSLQEKWRVFECEALAVGIDVSKEFADKLPWLRRVPSRITDERAYRIKRRTLSIDEQLAITAELANAQHTRTHEDSGFWGGAGPGI
jgi:hypothetical protein